MRGALKMEGAHFLNDIHFEGSVSSIVRTIALNNAFKRTLQTIKNTLESEQVLNRWRTDEKHFTRKRKLGLRHCVLLILSRITLSIQHELHRYFDRIAPTGQSVSQQAFSKARQCIKPEAFQTLYKITVNTALEPGVLKTYHGYRVFGVDGTEITMPVCQALCEAYPKMGKETLERPRARASILCDLMEGYVLDAQFAPRCQGERELAIRHLKALKDSFTARDILLFDRGYPSHALIALLEQGKAKYLMRVSKSFHADIDNRTSDDFIIWIKHEKKSYPVRVVAVMLPTGEMETLLTNLDANAFATEEFLALYALRWGVETVIHRIKNRLQLEKFSGKTPVSIEQEFYAVMLLFNLATMLAVETTEELERKHAGKNLKHRYVANYNLLIASLKDELPRLVLENSERERNKIYAKLKRRALIKPCPVQPGRSFPRPDYPRPRRKKFLRDAF